MLLGLAGIGAASYLVVSGIIGKAPAAKAPVVTVNGSAGPIAVPIDLNACLSDLALVATGGTPGGALSVFLCPSPSAKDPGCAAYPGVGSFDAVGAYAADETVCSGSSGKNFTYYFAVRDETTGLLSNWVRVNFIVLNTSYCGLACTNDSECGGTCPTCQMLVYTGFCVPAPPSSSASEAGVYDPEMGVYLTP